MFQPVLKSKGCLQKLNEFTQEFQVQQGSVSFLTDHAMRIRPLAPRLKTDISDTNDLLTQVAYGFRESTSRTKLKFPTRETMIEKFSSDILISP